MVDLELCFVITEMITNLHKRFRMKEKPFAHHTFLRPLAKIAKQIKEARKGFPRLTVRVQ